MRSARQAMLIRSEFDIQFQLPARTAMIAMLHLHRSVEARVREGNVLAIHSLGPDAALPENSTNEEIAGEEFVDSFGNRCTRFVAPAGRLRLSGTNLVEIDDVPDEAGEHTQQQPIEELPPDVLRFLLPSRYCEVDRFQGIAQDLFGAVPAGWQRAAAVRDWVHDKVRFDYHAARPTKTAMDIYTERVGVCRDYQHLAVTLSRCQNIPARYVTGYLGDIRRPYSGPGDFSAWYEVWLDGRWWTMDARHNEPRIGRVLMGTGRDAADVAITTSFGEATLAHFWVESNEVLPDGTLAAPEKRTLQAGAV